MTDKDQTNDTENLENQTEQTQESTAEETPTADAGGAQSSSEEVTKLKEALARATADYQNLLRRTEKDRMEMTSFFTQNLAKKLLPTLDNLDRVVSGTPVELQNWAVYEGVKQAASGLAKVLESMGVKPFESVWHELDPHFHEALSQGPGPAGKVVIEFEKGYKHGDEVIRHAKVIVGNGEWTPEQQ